MKFIPCLFLIAVFFCAAQLFSEETVANSHPLAVSISFGPDLENGTFIGFNAYGAVEYRFSDHLSVCFYSRYYYDYLTGDQMKSWYAIDHYESSGLAFGLEMLYYPFTGLLKYLFAGIAGYGDFQFYLFNGKELYTFFNLALCTRIGYKWVIFGDRGLFLQPSVDCIIPLSQSLQQIPYVTIKPRTITFFYLVEIGFVF